MDSDLGINLDRYGLTDDVLKLHANDMTSRDWSEFPANILESTNTLKIPKEYIGSLFDLGMSMSLVRRLGFSGRPTLTYIGPLYVVESLQSYLGLGKISEPTNSKHSSRLYISSKDDAQDILEGFNSSWQLKKVQATAILGYLNNEITRDEAITIVQEANKTPYTTTYQFGRYGLAAWFDNMEGGMYLSKQTSNKPTQLYLATISYGTEDTGVQDGLINEIPGMKRSDLMISAFPQNKIRTFLNIEGFAIYPLLKRLIPDLVLRKDEVLLMRDYLLTAAVQDRGLDNDLGYRQGGIVVGEKFQKIRDSRDRLRNVYLRAFDILKKERKK